MLYEYHSIGTGQRESQSTNVSREQETVDAGVGIERLNDSMTLVRVSASIQSHVCHGREVLLEEICLDDVQHLLHLTKDQHAMLGE